MSSEPEPQLEPRPSTENWNRQQLSNLGLLIYIFFLVFGLYFSIPIFRSEISEMLSVYSAPFSDSVPRNALGSNLECPVLLTTHETGTITVRVDNPFPEPSEYTVHVVARQFGRSHRTDGLVNVSGPQDMRAARFFGDDTFATSGTIPAYGAAKVIWKVTVTDRQGDYILVKVYADTDKNLFRDSCDIVLTNLPGFTGRQIVWLIVLGMLLGGLLWLYGRTPLGCMGHVGFTIGILLWLFITLMLNGLLDLAS